MQVLKDGFCFKRRLRTVNFHGKEILSPVNKRLSVEAAGSQVWRWWAGGGEEGGKVGVASSCRVQMHCSTFLDTGEWILTLEICHNWYFFWKLLLHHSLIISGEKGLMMINVPNNGMVGSPFVSLWSLCCWLIDWASKRRPWPPDPAHLWKRVTWILSVAMPLTNGLNPPGSGYSV